MSSINWIEILPCSDSTNVNDIFQSFYSHVARIIDKHAPMRKLSKKEIKSLSKPWISTGLKVSIKKRDKLYKRYLLSRDPYYLTKYRYYRNRICHLLRASKRNYYQSYFNVNNRNMKKIWSGIKSLISLKPRSGSIPSKIISNNRTLTYKSIAEEFNTFFASIGSTLSEKIAPTNFEPESFLGPQLANSFFSFQLRQWR